MKTLIELELWTFFSEKFLKIRFRFQRTFNKNVKKSPKTSESLVL